MRTTRRGLLAGVLAGAAAPSAAKASEPRVTPAAEGRVVREVRSRAVGADRARAVVTHRLRSTIAIETDGIAEPELLDVGGQPLEADVHERLAAVTTAFWSAPAVVIVDLDAATVLRRIEVGPAPYMPRFNEDGTRLVVSGGEQDGTLHVVDTRTWKVRAVHSVGRVPRGIAIDGDAVWVALQGDDEVALVGIDDGRARRRVKVRLPERVVLAGRKLRIALAGLRAGEVEEVRR